MERPEPFLNKVIPVLGAGLLIILLGGSIRQSANVYINQTAVRSDDTALQLKYGITYYHQKPFTGVVNSYYGDGTTARTIAFLNGREEGWMRSWYPDHNLEQERLYRNGKREGTHRGWWQNGKLKFDYNFENDLHEGLAREWFQTGRLNRSFHYVAGHEEGLQQLWWEDGAVRANYVVKNGQQFGLIGRKLCKNTLP